jgi:hypothetical protein
MVVELFWEMDGIRNFGKLYKEIMISDVLILMFLGDLTVVSTIGHANQIVPGNNLKP